MRWREKIGIPAFQAEDADAAGIVVERHGVEGAHIRSRRSIF